MRKICVVTGTRADFGILSRIMSEIKKLPDLELSIIATGMHLSKDHGYTIEEIKKSGFQVDAEIEILEKEDTGTAMAKELGHAIIGFAESFEKIKPDIVLLLGDRGEMLAAAISASHMNILTAHLHGGEVTGTIDDLLRNAITKIASIHLPATNQSKKNILAMNEKPERIFVVGAPGLDSIYAGEYASKNKVAKKLEVNLEKELLLIIQHPNTFEVEDSAQQVTETLEAITSLKKQSIIIYPNSDAGGRAMIDVIKKYEKLPFLKSYKTLPRDYYLGVMAISDVVIGNSSSAIIEASALEVPVVNIGSRQSGRERAKYILDVDYSRDEIEKAIQISLTYEHKELVKKSINPYGSGNTSVKVAKILAEISLERKMIEKN